MQRHKKHKNIHPFFAYTYIVFAIGISIWLFSVANPQQVKADDEAPFVDLLSQKDTAVQQELLKPDIVMQTNTIDQDMVNEIPVSNSDSTEFSVTVLPSGEHQSTKSVITLIFSKPVDVNSLDKNFNIVPDVAGNFSVNKNVITFSPNQSLKPGTKYNITINNSLASKDGQKLTTNAIASFTTNPQSHILAVPYYRQQFSRSCEAASLRMALAYKGIITNDEEIINLAGYNPTEPNWADRTWDDPYKMFVGFMSGSKLGYGMYASALAKAGTSLGSTNNVLKNPTSSQIAESIWNDNPVIIWGYIKGTVPELSYFYTKTGKRVPIYSNEHARIVVGVVGSIEDPVGFYIHDPLSGIANEYWTAEDLAKHMSIFGAVSNQALTVE